MRNYKQGLLSIKLGLYFRVVKKYKSIIDSIQFIVLFIDWIGKNSISNYLFIDKRCWAQSVKIVKSMASAMAL
jgi:hypothetical protein